MLIHLHGGEEEEHSFFESFRVKAANKTCKEPYRSLSLLAGLPQEKKYSFLKNSGQSDGNTVLDCRGGRIEYEEAFWGRQTCPFFVNRNLIDV